MSNHPKDSGPTLCFAMWILKNKFGDDETISISPADHIISDNTEYAQKVKLGHELCRKTKILWLRSSQISKSNLVMPKSKIYFAVDGTQVYTLTSLLKNQISKQPNNFSNHTNTCGIQLFYLASWQVFQELETHAPDLYQTTLQIDLNNLVKFTNTPISIDYSLIEKLIERNTSIPAELDWSDIELGKVFTNN